MCWRLRSALVDIVVVVVVVAKNPLAVAVVGTVVAVVGTVVAVVGTVVAINATDVVGVNTDDDAGTVYVFINVVASPATESTKRIIKHDSM